MYSIHGTGSVHARVLRSDEYSLMTLLARQLKWHEMEGTADNSQPTHGKFKSSYEADSWVGGHGTSDCTPAICFPLPVRGL
jgi:hypothetical protein